ncbi:MAG: c-type cytochrome [Pseudomonadales bacterium]
MKSLKVLFGLLAVLVGMSVLAQLVPPGTDSEIRERLQPFGQLCRAGEDCAIGAALPGAEIVAGAMSGEQVYDQFCATCHNVGVAGAPVLGDAAAWEPRLAQGMDTLWDHTLNGINAMPPKGTCMACSDEDLRASLDYMIEAMD